MFYIFFFLLLLSCDTPPQIDNQWQEITCRDAGNPADRHPMYRAKVPATWERHPPASSESIADTTKALCEFYIEKEVRVTVHSFPTEQIEMRIPPRAQLNRWIQQMDDLDPTMTSISIESHGGFVGLFLEAQGQTTKIMGWSMQLAPEYFSRVKDIQKKSDYTIKVIGPLARVDQNREDILQFANSFELIEELP